MAVGTLAVRKVVDNAGVICQGGKETCMLLCFSVFLVVLLVLLSKRGGRQ